MSWQKFADHPWAEPPEFAAPYAAQDMALLYSSRREASSGQYSFLLLEPVQSWQGNRWSDLPALPETGELPHYVGYLGYGMRNDVEQLSRGQSSSIDLPDFLLVQYGRLFRFDHDLKRIEEFVIPAKAGIHTSKSAQVAIMDPGLRRDDVKIKNLSSNLTRAEYEASIRATLEQIAAGNFYQANITRKFFGEFDAAPDYFALFQALCTTSPAPYSAYIRMGSRAILSSSPELFLSIADDAVTSRPIKGSAPRGIDEAADAAIRYALTTSSKNQAENLMIVDLMRHDLSHVSFPGSVKVAAHAELHSYATIHHLVSTVTARKLSNVSTYEVTRACFPPGSMTGAPKIAAMEWCTAQEKLERGVYSGALGWFGSKERCDLSVVIRTLVCDGNRFELQVGGGIVADSTPEEEWRETLIKARGIARALGIEEKELEAL